MINPSGMNLEMEAEITIIESGAAYENSYSVIDTNIFCAPTPTSTPTPTPILKPTPTLTSTLTPTAKPQQSLIVPVEWIIPITVVLFAIIASALLLRKGRK